MCMGVLPACVPVCYVYAWCQQRPEEGASCLGTGITDGAKHPLSYLAMQKTQQLPNVLTRSERKGSLGIHTGLTLSGSILQPRDVKVGKRHQEVSP